MKARRRKKIRTIIAATIITAIVLIIGITASINIAFRSFLASQVDALRPANLQALQTYINPATIEKSQMRFFQLIDPEVREVIKDVKVQFLSDIEFEEYTKDELRVRENKNAAKPAGSYRTYSTGKDEIIIRVTNTGTLQPVIIHEAGHAFDERMKVSEDEAFRMIVEEEIGNYAEAEAFVMKSSYIKDSVEDGFFYEYFAETFLDYYAYPLYLKVAAPKTYQYIENIVNQCKGDQL